MSLPLMEIPRRRNGRHQACEPCRRRKVSCGHEVPVCLRCRRRDTPKDCVYVVEGTALHFAPVGPTPVVTARLDSPADAAGSEPVSTEPRVDPQVLASPTVTLPAASPSQDGRGLDVLASPPAGPPTKNSITGFLGPTSFSAVYLETESSLASFQGQPSTASLSRESPELLKSPRDTPIIPPVYPYPAEQTLLDRGVEVLRLIPDLATGKELFRRHVNPNDAWNRLAVERVLLSLYDTFGSMLSHGDHENLRQMAGLLTQNTTRRLDDQIEDPDEWIASFSGQNLRWETLGVVFLFWASGSFNYGGWVNRCAIDELGNDDQARLERVVRFHGAAGHCIELAGPMHNYCVPMVHLRHRHAVLQSIISGDASLAFRTLHSAVAAVGTFGGMHADSPTSYTPTAASEARRQLFGTLFATDKSQATFAGRPPFLSRRYVSTPLPLDLPTAVLLEDRQTIAEAVARLDADGWSTDGRIYAATIARARTQLAYVRDAILEISLGHSQDTSVENILQIRDREFTTISKFPECIKYKAYDAEQLLGEHADRNPAPSPLGRGISDAAAFCAKALVHLEHLQNIFFLERLLASKRGRSVELLSTSIDMVSLTLKFWTHKNRLYPLNADFEWLVTGFAAPAGGVLCMELMNPTQRAPEEGPLDPKLSRSNIIQQLSLLVGFLSWVRPSAPNGEICESVKGIIQRAMDYTLNHPAGLPTTDQFVGLAASGLEIDANDVFFNFDLLDTFDWLRPDVIMSPVQDG
ncbi:hypothetical protein GQ53DRAFT_2520 [Thozetella sp. PMI_491]|nr:hypothetical protein GQ53DRAFT_2520 [Thozetella sp. PMI_491]